LNSSILGAAEFMDRDSESPSMLEVTEEGMYATEVDPCQGKVS
jgi:hypothetical protein